MNTAITRAPLAEKHIIANLMELYLHDFSEFDGLDVGDDGRYGYRYLDAYWTEPERHPFLFRSDGKLSGFSLVRQIEEETEPTFSIAKFFVLRKYRRRGVGAVAARQIFKIFPGTGA